MAAVDHAANQVLHGGNGCAASQAFLPQGTPAHSFVELV